MKPLLSPRDLAQSIGVSESSIKRWVDDGVIQATRTAGGHRRIAASEAIRFIRESQSILVRPEVLGLRDLAAVKGKTPAFSESADTLFEYLKAGAATEAKGLLTALFLGGRSLAQIVDGPLRLTMERIGDLWTHEPSAIFWEHRATEIAIQAISGLRGLFSPPDDGPVALGGAPAGDPYILPTLSVAAVLESLGVRAVNLGPDTPLSSLERGIEALEPHLVWLSLSVVPEAEDLSTSLPALVERLAVKGRTLIVGGSLATALDLAPHPNLHVGSSMAELEAFAKGFFGSVAPESARSDPGAAA